VPPYQLFVVRWVLPQTLALAVGAGLYLAGERTYSDGRAWAVLALSFAVLRIAVFRTDLASSTYVLDAVGSAVFIGGTGAAGSPFFALALAGAWWASMKARRGSLYALAFALGYLVLVAPAAIRAGDLAAAVYQPAFVVTIGILGDRLTEQDPSRWAFTVLHGSAEPGPESVRVGLSRAIRGGNVPIDVLLTEIGRAHV